jgi:alkaline phosphatase D
MRDLDRRSLLKAFAGLAGTFAITAQAQAASAPLRGVPDGNFRFPQGVASGDPQPRGIVLWTRVEATDGAKTPIALRAQLSKTPDFGSIVVDQVLTVKARYPMCPEPSAPEDGRDRMRMSNPAHCRWVL